MSYSKEFFSENGLISKHLPEYEIRPQQIDMAIAVEDVINNTHNLIVEAGTGTGKSLAYLVPFIKWADSEGKKVVISTYTKALQNQLYVKDLPFLRKIMELEFSFAMCLGTENYLCLKKASGVSESMYKTKKLKKQISRIKDWVELTETGVVTDMDFVTNASVWKNFCRESDFCSIKRCPFSDDCFYWRAKRIQSNSQILITNHSLLFADMLSEARVLPEFHAIVFDEAHTLEDIATTYFGKEASSSGLSHMLDSIKKILKSGIDKRSSEECLIQIEEANSALKGLIKASDTFFDEIEKEFGDRDRVIELGGEERFIDGGLEASFLELSSSLLCLGGAVRESEVRRSVLTDTPELIKAYAERFNRYIDVLDFILGHETEGYVYWLDIRSGRKDVNYIFKSAPIDISGHMRSHLFEKVSPVVLTSATIASSYGRGDFSFIKKRLGLEDPAELVLDSPFDYKKNVLLYLPKGVSDPNNSELFIEQITSNTIDIYNVMGGRMFVLFTSYSMLNKTAEKINDVRSDISILKQGELPRYVLLDVFKSRPDSVLLGTITFWQGVDVPGSALECVIITKFPFAVPSDPVNAARIEDLRKEGGNPFIEYQLPQALIMFRQGFGRLIRSGSDKGVVAVLDPRIRTRRYGKNFINSLPQCTQTEKISDIESFFSGR